MKFFNARRTAYRTNPRQMDDVIYTTYSYGTQDPPSSAPDEHNAPSSGGRSGGASGRGLRRGTASAKWRSSGSDGETTTTAVETPNREVAHTGAPAPTTISPPETGTGDLLGVPELAVTDSMTAMPPTTTAKRKGSKWDAVGSGDAEIFLFSYGTVVIWGMTEQQERRFLSSL